MKAPAIILGKFSSLVLLALLAGLGVTPLAACSKVAPHPANEHTQQGLASFYSDVLHGRPTASGERYDKDALTAAHRTLPMDTKVRVTRVKTGDSVVVRINDRGPFVKGRIIDLSRRAARDLGITGHGVAEVLLEVIGRPDDGA